MNAMIEMFRNEGVDTGVSILLLIGLEDPNPGVDGQGASKLQAAGIKVRSGMLAQEVEKQRWLDGYRKAGFAI